jgi:hypothetical protein
MHSRQSLKQLLLDAVRERDEEIGRLHAALRRQQERLARIESSSVS